MSQVKGKAILSKKRYEDIRTNLLNDLDEKTVNKVLDVIKNILHFDPDQSTYNEQQGKYIKDYRNRLKEKKNKESI